MLIHDYTYIMKQKQSTKQISRPQGQEDNMERTKIRTHKGKEVWVEKKEDRYGNDKYLIDGKWMNLPRGWEEV